MESNKPLLKALSKGKKHKESILDNIGIPASVKSAFQNTKPK